MRAGGRQLTFATSTSQPLTCLKPQQPCEGEGLFMSNSNLQVRKLSLRETQDTAATTCWVSAIGRTLYIISLLFLQKEADKNYYPVLEMGKLQLRERRREPSKAPEARGAEFEFNAASELPLSCLALHRTPNPTPDPNPAQRSPATSKHKLQHQSTPPDTAPLTETERQRQRQGQTQTERRREGAGCPRGPWPSLQATGTRDLWGWVLWNTSFLTKEQSQMNTPPCRTASPGIDVAMETNPFPSTVWACSFSKETVLCTCWESNWRFLPLPPEETPWD